MKVLNIELETCETCPYLQWDWDKDICDCLHEDAKSDGYGYTITSEFNLKKAKWKWPPIPKWCPLPDKTVDDGFRSHFCP